MASAGCLVALRGIGSIRSRRSCLSTIRLVWVRSAGRLGSEAWGCGMAHVAKALQSCASWHVARARRITSLPAPHGTMQRVRTQRCSAGEPLWNTGASVLLVGADYRVALRATRLPATPQSTKPYQYSPDHRRAPPPLARCTRARHLRLRRQEASTWASILSSRWGVAIVVI